MIIISIKDETTGKLGLLDVSSCFIILEPKRAWSVCSRSGGNDHMLLRVNSWTALQYVM